MKMLPAVLVATLLLLAGCSGEEPPDAADQKACTAFDTATRTTLADPNGKIRDYPGKITDAYVQVTSKNIKEKMLALQVAMAQGSDGKKMTNAIGDVYEACRVARVPVSNPTNL